MNICQHLAPILKLTEAEGNTILSVSHSELMDKVIWMNSELSSTLRTKIQQENKNLEYRKTTDAPHNPSNEGFICNECKNVIVFPSSVFKKENTSLNSRFKNSNRLF